MRFAKYQGLGNDFVIVAAEAASALDGATVRRICDRRFGIGADGVLVVGPGDAAPWRMTVHNADGSIPEMCGNGLRCVVRYLRDRDPTLPSAFAVETGAGPLPVRDASEGVTVQMGSISDRGARTIRIGERLCTGRALDLGNPHFVMFGRWSEGEVHRLGPALSVHPDFEAGANVSFAEVEGDGRIGLRVWERGAGLTLACGTGACATAAAAWLEGRVKVGPVQVTLPGGVLRIGGEPSAIEMTGDAQAVFEGVWRR